ncbi:conserved hypothetical protein [Ixodes scapularis]|uniref:TIL domain-containing protein n=1 Tax=Ixodes scapularis TaxID=6945 RepID=B7QB27_IXOSC|nr:conserved hypothetical protein [Ixodes scapularis]|eukprot:XP_002412753.1 conserved hypothetical protein [Ixodes scapularis]
MYIYIFFLLLFCFILQSSKPKLSISSPDYELVSYFFYRVSLAAPHGCPKNETYKECQSSTCGERRCGEPKPGGSFLDCGTGCFCNSGYFRVLNESCVLK